ncbi:hypothetical protein OPV22_031642 [Ensete ventricosum]|uniref:Uncharacterized protein n=2 Tax=Ensete ventricosum TaxID=4639 RepID=A0A445M915_ENSVE|nr:hypothetical protein OPV22_031642 [Ensete ventricosum]RWW33407.1 hypothetical protein GW17_00001873 [Ensete ventricosum]RWW78753.1 hypothetical protein BHE74_00013009 [Ensete ventricosum]RZR70718.1 hypothetical protein BHM03_00001158 [Ensete ventricosum]
MWRRNERSINRVVCGVELSASNSNIVFGWTFRVLYSDEKKKKKGMGNNLRCCLALHPPLGRLRRGSSRPTLTARSRSTTAATSPPGRIMAANLDHFLTQPCSQGVARRTLVVPEESQLNRGHIYFLVPTSTSPAQQKQKKSDRREKPAKKAPSIDVASSEDHGCLAAEKKPSHRRRWSGRVGAWRPCLESVREENS